MAGSGSLMRLSPQRRLIGDLMWLSRDVPLVTFQRRMALGPLRSARETSNRRPTWTALFVKAYALLAAERPELRRIYVPLPRPSLFQCDQSIARIAVDRTVGGEAAVLFSRIIGPEHRELPDIGWRLRNAAEGEPPVFARQLRFAGLPGWARRLAWLAILNVSPARRARIFGTFAISNTGQLGAWAVHLRAPTTAVIHTGPIDGNGCVDFYLTFDHRVLDGAPVAGALADLEEMLNGPVREAVNAL